jgi:hypothetical protein
VEVEPIRPKLPAISHLKLSSLANRGLRSARTVQGSPTRGPHAWSGLGLSNERAAHLERFGALQRGAARSVGTGAPEDDGGKQTQAAHNGSNNLRPKYLRVFPVARNSN